MSVGQMLAHLNVMFEMTFEDIHPKPNAFLKFILKALVKNKVVGEKPYPKNGKTAPQFIIKESRDFDVEKNRLLNYLMQVEQKGKSHFHNREYISFGVLFKTEWSNLFYKHIDHHLKQFGK